ncbi:MAG: hydantoinase B/oxoprolinase family protein, partial [Planctomycetales bacterium]|nr:hydantoinase B/oxoprolinase family protein [Planctomycetales bacterium]
GGAGRHRGGEGVVRRLEFLEPLELSLITQRRGQHPPYGMAGGKPGEPGINQLIKVDGSIVTLPAICQRSVTPGELLIIQTPGGGGYGKPE